MVENRIDGEYKNFAFISYRDEGEDAEMAHWLQEKLESFKIPAIVRQKNPSLPKYCRPVFEYKRDAEGGPLEKLYDDLKKSKYLIVICSPNAPKSEHVKRGIEYFISQKKDKYIIPLIIKGKVHADDADEECFPEPLRKLGKDEPRGININTEGGKEIASVKIFAYMMGVSFNSVWDVYQKEKIKIRYRIFFALLSVLLMILLFSAKVLYDSKVIREQKNNLLISQSLYMSKEANELAKIGCYRKAQLLAAEALPTSINNPDRPYVVEVEEALRNSLNMGDYNKPYVCIDNLHGHGDGIWFADVDEQKEMAVSYAQDGTIRAWNIKSSEQIYSEFIGHDRPLGLFLLPSLHGQKVLLVFSNHIYIWDIILRTAIKKFDFSEITIPVMDKKRENLAFFEKKSQHIHILNVVTGESIEFIDISEKDIESISINMESHLLGIGTGRHSGSNKGSVSIWDIQSQKIIAHTSLEDAVEKISLSPDGSKIAYSQGDGNIFVAEILDMKRVKVMSGHTKSIISMTFSPSRKNEILSSSYDGDIILWNTESGEKTMIQKKDGESFAECLVYSPSGEVFVGGLWEKLMVWGRPKISYSHVFGNQVNGFYYSSDGKKLFFTEEGSLSFYCIDTQTFIKKAYSGYLQPIKWDWYHNPAECKKYSKYIDDSYEITYGCNSENDSIAYIAYEDFDSNLFVEKLHTYNGVIRSLGKVHLRDLHSCANDLTLSSDGKLLVVSCGVLDPIGNAAVVVDTDKMKEVSRFEDFNSGVQMSCIIPNSDLVVSCSMDMSVKIWDYKKNKMFKHIKEHHDMMDNVSCDNEGIHFVSSCQDGSVIIWDITTMKPIERMQFSCNNLHTAISPNGKTIALIDQGKLIIKELLPYEKLVLDVRGE